MPHLHPERPSLKYSRSAIIRQSGSELSIPAIIISTTISIIVKIGYPGIFVLMLLEGMLLPIPSEVVMAFGGYLVVTGALQAQLGIPAVILLLVSGTAGNVAGASIAYYIGKLGGLRLIVRYGRYLLIDNKSVMRAQRFFDKYGSISVFATRLVPIFRTFISIPAGVAQMDIRTFLLYTSLGTLSWNSILIYLGFTLGSKWQLLLPFFDFLTYVVALLIAAIFIWWLFSVFRRRSRHSPAR